MTTKHTPGPWGWYDAIGPLKNEADVSIVASRLADLSPVPVTIVVGTLSGEVRVSNEANALLIAAAPALLELARTVAAEYQCQTDGCMCIGGSEELCLGATAKVAIAAATGKE